MRIFLAGGTGLIGSRLIERLRERGDEIRLLTRRPAAAREKFGDAVTIVEGDPMKPGPWMDSISDCDAVINLVGESLFNRRWNEEFKQLLRDSRVFSTAHMVEAIGRNPRRPDGTPKVLVNASAIGYYGARGDEELTEEDAPGNDFQARLCAEWEAAARKAEAHGVRTALIRIGVVLDPGGGALAQMITPFKLGLGGRIGSGRQWLSWIHYEDVVGIVALPLDNGHAAGPINCTAPQPVPNRDFTKALGRALHRPTIFPIPPVALKIRFGQVAEVLTTGQRVVPRKALDLGYGFKYSDIDSALRNLR